MYAHTITQEQSLDNQPKVEVFHGEKKNYESTSYASNANQYKSYYKNTDVLKIIQAEFSINHCSTEIRTLLCKGSTQEKIRELCEAYVSTKGRYIPPGQNENPIKPDKPFGLYLFIQGPNKRSVDLAIVTIETIINTGEVPRSVPAPLMGINTAAPPPAVLQQPNIHTMPPPPPLHSLMQMQVPPPTINLLVKLPIAIERPLPSFNLPMKLIGQNGSNLQYIRNETGAVVTLRGIGSAFIEPTTGQEAQEVLHFSIEHSKADGLATARELALNLIATVQQEYSQYVASQGGVDTMVLDHGMVMHAAPPMEGQLLHQPMLSTSISLPVMQTATGIIQQQPSVLSVPPPQFSQPPPTQLSLPPPGVHIPQQTLPPPGVHIPSHTGPLPPPLAPPPTMIPPPMTHQAPPMDGQQQQYLITQNGQPVQGIMTSQGFVVLNQQPQQVFLSQPQGQPNPVIHQGQLSFQSASPNNAATPVSYQLQYVQQAPLMTMAGSHAPVQLHQPPPQSHTIMLQPQQQVQLANGAVHFSQPQMIGMKPNDQMNQIQLGMKPNEPMNQLQLGMKPSDQMSQMQLGMKPGDQMNQMQLGMKQSDQMNQMQQQLAPGSVVQVKSMPQPVHVVQQYSPTVQYVSSPGVRPDQSTTPKESRLGKRKFTEEAETNNTQKQSPQLRQSSPQHTHPQLVQMGQAEHLHSLVNPQQLMQPPPHHYQPVPNPQPVPHPSQTVRQGVGMQDVMGVSPHDRSDGMGSQNPGESGTREGKAVPSPTPTPPSGNGQQFSGPPPHGTNVVIDSLKHSQPNQWFEEKARNDSPGVEYRRERTNRERQTFNHYSGKPQLYGYQNQSYIQSNVCPPPPPPPPTPPMHQQPGQGQQRYYVCRR